MLLGVPTLPSAIALGMSEASASCHWPCEDIGEMDEHQRFLDTLGAAPFRLIR